MYETVTEGVYGAEMDLYDTSQPVLTAREATVLWDIRIPLAMQPPFPSVAAGVVEIQRTVKALGECLCEEHGTGGPRTRAALLQTVVMCLRVLTETAPCA